MQQRVTASTPAEVAKASSIPLKARLDRRAPSQSQIFLVLVVVERIGNLVDYMFAKQRWVAHATFWVFVLGFYVAFFGRKESNYGQTFFFVSLLMPVTIGATYFLNYFLLPRYLMKARYGRFLLYFAYTLIGSIFLEMMVAMITLIVMADIRIREMSSTTFDLIFLLTSLLMVVLFAGAIKMVLHWLKSKEDYQRLQRDKVELELKFLKTQLHPHFLFNTLNNLYYLTLEKSDKAPKAILALSELLEYVLHETQSTFVPLETELHQVHNYVALESLRYDDRLEVKINVSDNACSKRIAPMLLITLVENSFKHGVTKTTGSAWIRLDIGVDANKTVVNLKNSAAPASMSGPDGVGLTSIRGQLNMLYRDRAKFLVNRHEDSFEVKLELAESI